MKKATVRMVDTPHGEGRLHTRRATSPIATLLLSHGAGGGVEARDLWALADALPAVTALDPAARVHLYGKEVRPGRKLGHVTVTGADLADVRARAQAAAAVLRGDHVTGRTGATGREETVPTVPSVRNEESA